MAERVTIRELVVKLLFEGSESGVTKFNMALGSFRQLAGYAQDAARALSDTVRSVTLDIADQADALDEAAQQVGVTAGVYDSLSAVLALNGGTAGELDAVLRTLSGTMDEFVRTGKGAGADAFTALLGPDARKRLSEVESVDQALGLVADGLSRIQDPMRQVALANDVLGRSGNKLLPTIKDGSAALGAALEEQRRLATFSPELIAASSRLSDGLAGLSRRALGVRVAFGEETVPALADLVDELNLAADALRELLSPAIRAAAQSLAGGFRQIRDWVKSLRTEIAQSERAIAALKTTLIFLGFVLSIVGLQMLWMSRFALERLIQSTIVWGVETAIAGTKAMLAWAKAALPVVLLAALLTGIVLILQDLYVYVTGGESAFGRLLARMRETSPTLAALSEALRLLFGGGLGEALFDAFDALRTKSQEIIDSIRNAVLAIPDAVRAALSSLGDAVPDVLKGLGRGLGAIPGAFVQAGSALIGGGRTNNVNVGGSSVSVAVNGAGDPRATGAEVARQVDEGMSRHATRVARDLSSALAY